jgi:Kef-type K+ transport system membrane component KefB
MIFSMSRIRLVVVYASLVGIPLWALLLILDAGGRLTAPGLPAASPAVAPVGAAQAQSMLTLVLQIAVIIGASRIAGPLFRRFGQPRVIGEMFAGIMLGPSLFGWLAPGLSAVVFPPATLGNLNALSQVGILIYMFIVGLDVDIHAVRRHSRAAVLTSHVSIIVPFVLGAALALFLYPRLSDMSVGFTNFALFMGASMSITAFPVLARILTERRMLGTTLGSLAIACAATDDVTGWCILAYVVLHVRAGAVATPLWTTLGGLAVFVAAMLYGGTRLFQRFETAFRREGRVTDNMLALLLLVALACALITERLGLHLLFGAFLAGASMPRNRTFIREVLDRLEAPIVVLLLPLYFAFTGLRTSISLIAGSGMWAVCGAIVVIAVAGKLGGSAIAARVSGTSWRQSLGLGILMNTRGLMELVILNVGLDIGVLSPKLFSMMVLMALVTTFMTAPLLEWAYPTRLIAAELADRDGRVAAARQA